MDREDRARTQGWTYLFQKFPNCVRKEIFYEFCLQWCFPVLYWLRPPIPLNTTLVFYLGTNWNKVLPYATLLQISSLTNTFSSFWFSKVISWILCNDCPGRGSDPNFCLIRFSRPKLSLIRLSRRKFTLIRLSRPKLPLIRLSRHNRSPDQTFQTEGVLIRPSSDHGPDSVSDHCPGLNQTMIRLKCARRGQTQLRLQPLMIRLKCARNQFWSDSSELEKVWSEEDFTYEKSLFFLL